ncbi:MAG: stage II sporulation protein R [Eubacteriales bacterium]
MDRKMKRWELALMCGVLCALALGGWLDREQERLADQVIRLHVIANSDSPEDQALKLEVRDQVLAHAEELYPAGADRTAAAAAIQEHLPELAAAGQRVLEERGCDYAVRAELTETWFPTKEYEDFALPAGEYTALRVVIGEGAGQNWWCVAFPPLCLGAASETVEEAAQAGRFTDDQAALMTGETQGYVLKFKAIELWEGLKRLTGGCPPIGTETTGLPGGPKLASSTARRPPPPREINVRRHSPVYGLWGAGAGRAKDSMNLLHGTIYNLTLEKMY